MKVLATTNKLSVAARKLILWFKLLVAVEIAKMRMKVGITAVNEIHKYYAKQYLDPDYKTLRQYIVILERPMEHKKYSIERKGLKLKLIKRRIVKMEERLFWVNFKNFKAIKKAGWLPKSMRIDELRAKAFYYTSLTRSYQDEYRAKQKAIKKYVTYVKEAKPC